MKKILHIIAQKPGQTGSGVYLNSILEQADRHNCKQAVICGIDRKDETDFPIFLQAISPIYFQTDELPFPVVGMSDVMPYLSTRYRDLTEEMYEQWKNAFSQAIEKIWNEFQPDIIFCHHLWLLTSLTRKLLPQTKLIAICHGTGLRQMKLAPQYAQTVKEGCKKVDFVLASNDFQREEISQVYDIDKNRMKIISNGFNNSIFCPCNNKKPSSIKTLVYVGKLAYSKGVLSLIRAIQTIDFPLELIIIGSGCGMEAKKIKDVAQKSKHKIIFTGVITQNKIAAIFQRADAFVLPSFFEGLPLVVIEALACGLPVVCSDLPGLRDWLGEKLLQTGCIEFVPLPQLVKMDIPVAEDLPMFEFNLKKAIEKQLTTPFSEQYQQFIQSEIAHYSWEKIFNKIKQNCTL